MALGTDLNNLCPLFDFGNSGGVLFPYYPMLLGQSDGNAKFIDLDGTSNAIHARVRVPFPSKLITCEAFAVSDASATKAAAATTEPIVGIVYGTYPLGSAGAGTSIGVITCDLTGDVGHKWAGTTTATEIATTEEVMVYLKTAAVSATTANQSGGSVPVLWFAQVNSPS